MVAVAGAVLELGLGRVHFDTGVGAAAEVGFGHVNAAQFVVGRTGVLAFGAAATVADGLAE